MKIFADEANVAPARARAEDRSERVLTDSEYLDAAPAGETRTRAATHSANTAISPYAAADETRREQWRRDMRRRAGFMSSSDTLE